jgi:hypothetical protein
MFFNLWNKSKKTFLWINLYPVENADSLSMVSIRRKKQFVSNLLEQKSMVYEFVMKHCEAMHHSLMLLTAWAELIL